MSLKNYKEKRNFDSTNEPKGVSRSSEKELVFVVQKHAATRLHYDFRLEMEGVLKSWAVPKGPSMNPDDKRLAVMVEDHPYDYKDFEGNIAKGNYGAGNVIVWDNGTYEPVENTKNNPEKALLAQLSKGHLRFKMHGQKLKGDFSLVKLKGKDENAWLLIKHTDEFSSGDDILKRNKSVISDISLEDLQAKFPRSKSKSKSAEKKTKSVKNTTSPPGFISPMLAETAEKPFDEKDWIFEIKFDGYRTIAVVNNKNVELFSRNEQSFTESFKNIATALKKLDNDCVLDGEVVIEDETGKSNFQLLQNFRITGTGDLKYHVFDILNLDGNNTQNLGLLERKELLKLLLDNNPIENVFYSDHITENGKDFFQLAVDKKLEGIMAKKALSPYRSGKRSSEWLKIRITMQEEVIIAGITAPKGSRNYFGALLMAQYENNELVFVGKCGTGFTEETLKYLFVKLEPLLTDKSPFTKKPKIAGKVMWVKPELIAQIKFTQRTTDGYFRHPVFLGLRDDKKVDEIQHNSMENSANDSKVEMKKTPNNYDVKISGKNLHLTNQNKIYFPDKGYTKGDVVNYYSEIAEFILPYLKNRPQSMNRFPNGIKGKSFYQKDVDVDKIPTWLKTVQIYSESSEKQIDYLICNDKATLIYMANLGCIEINPWNSTFKNTERPDWLVIDLDPEGIGFEYVVKVALVVKEVFDEINTKCYCKTSGATGLHIYVPLAAKYDYEPVKILAQYIAKTVNTRLPDFTSIERSTKKRKNKVYIDYLQNRKGQTIAAPYALRPKPGATVSMPLLWNEVNMNLSPLNFTIKNALARLEKMGDLWQPVLKEGASIESIISQIDSL